MLGAGDRLNCPVVLVGMSIRAVTGCDCSIGQLEATKRQADRRTGGQSERLGVKGRISHEAADRRSLVAGRGSRVATSQWPAATQDTDATQYRRVGGQAEVVGKALSPGTGFGRLLRRPHLVICCRKVSVTKTKVKREQARTGHSVYHSPRLPGRVATRKSPRPAIFFLSRTFVTARHHLHCTTQHHNPTTTSPPHPFTHHHNGQKCASKQQKSQPH